MAETYLVMDQNAANNDPTLAVAANINPAHRDANQSVCQLSLPYTTAHRDFMFQVLSEEEYNRNYQQTRMSVQPQTVGVTFLAHTSTHLSDMIFTTFFLIN